MNSAVRSRFFAVVSRGVRSSSATLHLRPLGSRLASSATAPTAAPQKTAAPVGLVGLTGAPIASPGKGGTDPAIGAEIEITAENAQQILGGQSVFLLQAGTTSLGDAANKKIVKLRQAAGGRLPVVKLDCTKLPQVCEALQIKSDPSILLMARGQVAAALEGDIGPQAVTGFVDQVAKALGLKVDLAGDAGEQLIEAEQSEAAGPAEAHTIFEKIAADVDVPNDAKVRAFAGCGRCAVRLGRASDGQQVLTDLSAGGHERTPEVKQLAALLHLDELRQKGDDPSIDDLRSASTASPADVAATEALAVALFWSSAAGEEEAVQAGIKLLLRNRSDEAKKLVLSLLEGIGPRHPRAAALKRKFSSALFV